MNIDEMYIKNVIIPLEKMIYYQRIRVKKSFIFKNREKKVLFDLERELLSKYLYLEKEIHNKIYVK